MKLLRRNPKDGQPSKAALKIMKKIDEIDIHKSISDIWPYTFAAYKPVASKTPAGGLNDS